MTLVFTHDGPRQNAARWLHAVVATVLALSVVIGAGAEALAQAADCDDLSYAERIAQDCEGGYESDDPVDPATESDGLLPERADDLQPGTSSEIDGQDAAPEIGGDSVNTSSDAETTEAGETNDDDTEQALAGSSVSVTNAQNASGNLPIITGAIGVAALGSVVFIGVKRSRPDR